MEANSNGHVKALVCGKPAEAIFAAGFELAYFIHRSPGRARRVVETAAAHLDRASEVQVKRFYYHCPGQSSEKSDQFRNKVTLDEAQLFQLLIYRASEPFEKSDETYRADSIDLELLVVRFVKQLVQLTLPRNAFYVLVGLGRILFDYTIAELTAIYDYLYSGSCRMRDDCYYRSRKALLMRELGQRFGNCLSVARGSRGERRFLAAQAPAGLQAAASRALSNFTPWNTPCLSESHHVWNESAAGRRIAESDHATELSRMHALLHPQCLERICSEVGLDAPSRRLRIPKLEIPRPVVPCTAAQGDMPLSLGD